MKSIKQLLIFFTLTTVQILPQNINAKLGLGGMFNITNSENNPLISLNESDGSISIKGNSFFFTNNDGKNLFFGLLAGNPSSTGLFNTAIGYKSLTSNLASGNTTLGYNTLYSNTTGANNTAIGFGSQYFNTVGYELTSVGAYSLGSNTTGVLNTAIGASTLAQNTTGSGNTAIGYQSQMRNTTGGTNVSVGASTLEHNLTGSSNCAFGNLSLYSNTTGDLNIAIGIRSLFLNETGFKNIAIGYTSLENNAAGFHNTAIGYESLRNNIGNYNTALGFNAGSTVTTGANLTLLGIDANPSSPTAFDEITLGNQFVQTLRCNVTTITSLSDARDKKNIKDLSLGLEFLMKIQPREFNWDRREWYSEGKSDGSKMQEIPTAGFIAQELDKVQIESNAEWLKLVLKENPERIEASAGNLFPVVVKAIQDLKNEKDKEIALLKSENEKLKSELELIKELHNRLAKIEQVVKIPDVKFTSNITE